MADLPDISTDLNDPLPESPDPSMTPYRIVARPGAGVEGPENVVTGWGRRGPITPPQPMGGGVPDMSGAYTSAFQHLPVDEAIKAINVANKFVAMRGYQSDLAKGTSQAEAVAKWGPMLFGTGTGIPEALKAIQAQKINPYQQAQLNQRQAEMMGRQSQAAAILKQRQAEAAAKQAIAQGQLDLKKGQMSEVDKEDLKDAYKELDEERKQYDAAAATGKADNTGILKAWRRIRKITGLGDTTNKAKGVPPTVGDMRSGYMFKGGDPSKKENWEKVQ